MLFEIGGEILRQRRGILSCVTAPAHLDHLIDIFVVDRLFLRAPDTVEEVNKGPGKHIRRGADELVACLVALRIGRFSALGCCDGYLLDPIGVDRLKEAVNDVAEALAVGEVLDVFPIFFVQLPFETCKAPGERTDRVFVAHPQS